MKEEFLDYPSNGDAHKEENPYEDIDDLDFEDLTKKERHKFFNYIFSKIKKQLNKEELKLISDMVRGYARKYKTDGSGFELYAICNWWADKNNLATPDTPEDVIQLALAHPKLLKL